MTTSEFLNGLERRLPTDYMGNFEDHVDDLLTNKFIAGLGRINDWNFSDISLSEFIKLQEYVVNGLKICISQYLDGKPGLAFDTFCETIGAMPIHNFMTTFNGTHSFYRIRHCKTPITDVGEMFHIPFHRRELVSDQRFSIAGFPTLYLGKSLYCCWIEIGRPNLDEISIIRLTERRGMRYLDLRRHFPEDQQYLFLEILRWPLLAITSVRKLNRNAGFHPEYIVPQLVLQWVRINNERFDGVVYNSTRINNSSGGWISNISIPVKAVKKHGYCEYLKRSFNSTKPITVEELKKLRGRDIQGMYRAIQISLADDGHLQPYEETIFFDLEKKLLGMECFPIHRSL